MQVKMWGIQRVPELHDLEVRNHKMTLENNIRHHSCSLFSDLQHPFSPEHTVKSEMKLYSFLSYFEKNSSLVGLNFGLCIYVSMYVFFLCIGLCHTNQIEATILPWKVIHQ